MACLYTPRVSLPYSVQTPETALTCVSAVQMVGRAGLYFPPFLGGAGNAVYMGLAYRKMELVFSIDHHQPRVDFLNPRELLSPALPRQIGLEATQLLDKPFQGH